MDRDANVRGPMMMDRRNGFWESTQKKDGGHYNTFTCKDIYGLSALRQLFPDGKTDAENWVLFSTSGVHGSYGTIEDAEERLKAEWIPQSGAPYVTFLVIQPRLVTMRYGNCFPKTPDDIYFLKALRASALASVSKIGLKGDL